MTLQLTAELELRLRKLASRTDELPDQLALRAVQEYVDDQEDLLAAVKDADEQFERGEIISHGQVAAHFAKRFTKA